MDSHTKVVLKRDGECKPLDLYDDGQWENYDDDMISSANISETSYTESNDVLNPILSAPQYKPPRVTFLDDVAFTMGATEGEFSFEMTELDTH